VATNRLSYAALPPSLPHICFASQSSNFDTSKLLDHLSLSVDPLSTTHKTISSIIRKFACCSLVLLSHQIDSPSFAWFAGKRFAASGKKKFQISKILDARNF
jgi:hypothetical protein